MLINVNISLWKNAAWIYTNKLLPRSRIKKHAYKQIATILNLEKLSVIYPDAIQYALKSKDIQASNTVIR